MIFLQEIASRKIFLGAYLALKFQKKHKNEIIRRKIRAKNTRRYEKHARKKNQKKFHRSLRIRRPGVRVPSSAPRKATIKRYVCRCFSFYVRVYLKSQNYRLFLQTQRDFALKSFGIHKGFLRFFALHPACVCEISVIFFVFRYTLAKHFALGAYLALKSFEDTFEDII